MTPSCQHALVIPGTDVCPLCHADEEIDKLQDVISRYQRELGETIKFNAVTFLPGDQSVGASIQWATGTPYSQIRVRQSCDILDSCFLRTTFPTHQRNDQRNEGIWNIDLNYRKNFTFGKNHASVGIEVQDLLNSDDLIINSVDTTRFLGLNSQRHFGRRWQLSAEFHF